MKASVLILIMAGLAVATGIAAYLGFGAVFMAISRVGWRGLAVLTLYSALPFCLLGSAWALLNPEYRLGRWPRFIWARIVRDSAGELLPFSHLGGFVLGARAAVERGISPTAAYSTTVVDVTAELIAQLGFTGLGLALLAMRLGSRSAHNALIGAALIGLGLSAAGAVSFIALQRRGGDLVEQLAARFLPGAADQAGKVLAAINVLYQRPTRLAGATVLHLAAWVASAVGIWLALRSAGVAIDLPAVLAIESLVGAVKSAAFMSPMGIGVQEASYALLGPLFGLGPELSLAVSLLKRARDLVIGAPALLAWQGLEGLRLANREPG